MLYVDYEEFDYIAYIDDCGESRYGTCTTYLLAHKEKPNYYDDSASVVLVQTTIGDIYTEAFLVMSGKGVARRIRVATATYAQAARFVEREDISDFKIIQIRVV